MKITIALLLVLIGIAERPSMLMAQSSGAFTPTGNLSVPRQSHTATLLPNGKVLIAGGFGILNGWPVWASAELYDPSTGTFGQTGSMTTSRNSHTATLLPDGKVLIAGGDFSAGGGSGSSALATSELYDPANGTFAATGTMTTARRSHTATLLNNGKVLIAGGVSCSASGAQIFLGTAELYDSSTGAFTATGSMKSPRSFHTATLLNNGKVFINSHFNYATGDDDGRTNDDLASAELYDPDSRTFSLTNKTAYPSLGRVTSSSLLTNGKVLNTLEYSCDPAEQAELYDPSIQTFSATGNMMTARGDSTSTLLPDGRVLVAGQDFGRGAGSADLYDADTGRFSTTADMTMQRSAGHTATLLPGGAVLMSGGWICCGYTVGTAEIYHPSVLVPSPVLLSLSGDGHGPGAILHSATHQIVSSANPAFAGEALEIYGAGLLGASVIPPQIAIGGRLAEILFFGEAPGFVGLNQMNVRVPNGVSPGPDVPVRLTYLGRPSNAVSIVVR